MTKPRILVIGEAMRDRYWIGESTRISPEAPVPVVKISEMKEFAGGAANVVTNLIALGADVRLLGTAYQTPIKNRLMVGNYQLARWDQYDKYPQIDPSVWPEKSFDAIILSDYGKGGFADTRPIYECLKDVSGPIFIDTKQNPVIFNCFQGATFFPNRKEFAEFEEYYKKLDCVLKLGVEGLEYKGFRHPSLAKNIVSVSGAGDTVIAAWVYQIVTACDICVMDRVMFALNAAAVVCAKPFTATASLAEIERFENDH